MSDAFYVIRHCITGGKAPLQYCKTALATLYPGTILAAVVMTSLLLLFLFDVVNEKRDTIQVVSSWPAWVRWPAYVVFLLLLIPKESTTPFIYFQF